MADELTVSASGFDEIEARIEKLVELCADLRLFWPLVVPLYVGWMGSQFDSEGSFFGEQWAPLSDDYAAWKTVNYPTRGILTAEGDLRSAAQSPARFPTATSLTLRIESFEKARGPGKGRTIEPEWFQDGTNNMPARPLLPDGPIPAAADVELSNAAEFYVTDMVRRLGL